MENKGDGIYILGLSSSFVAEGLSDGFQNNIK